MNIFIEESEAVVAARRERLLRRENTFRKVAAARSRAEHPELGRVTIVSKWMNSRGQELSRVIVTKAGRDSDDSLLLYEPRKIQYANCTELSKGGAR